MSLLGEGGGGPEFKRVTARPIQESKLAPVRTSHASSRLRNVSIPGPEGVLEGIVRTPERPDGAAVMAHPHPLFGGTMHTKVVHAASRLMADRLGLVSVRFNFRGVGASAGTHDEGRGEVD